MIQALMPPALDIQNLSANYGSSKILENLSLSIPDGGHLVGILGPNGAGKSTFLKALLQLCPKVEGTVRFFGFPLKKMAQKIAYVPQKDSLDWDFPITVKELVLMGRYGHLKWWQKPSLKDHAIVEKSLNDLGILSLANNPIQALSGGQKQRACLARSLAQESQMYLLDEPFTGIDLATQQAVIALLKELQKQGKTAFVVHHDLNSIYTLFDWVILLNHQLIGFGPIEQTITPETLQATYENRQPS